MKSTSKWCNTDWLKERKVVIATMHAKEKVIAPLVKQQLGLHPFVPENLNTDSFGTFTGEIERKLNPIETAKAKCEKAMELTGADIAIANEGSFGPHPSYVFIPADQEVVYLFDKKNDIEIFSIELDTSTNFNAKEIKNKEELHKFGLDVGFPSHAIILKNAVNCVKGIKTWELLNDSYRMLSENNSLVFAETDMRAMHNPTRMKVIENATKKLIEKVNCLCPNCNFPGFDVQQIVKGLPCKWCGSPTRSVKSHHYGCKKCNHVSIVDYPYQKKIEEPDHCDYCNP